MPEIEMLPSETTRLVEDAETAELYSRLFFALANPTRVRIVLTLMDGERTVSQLTQLLEVSQSQVSNQLTCLRWCGFVQARREGRRAYYTLADARVRRLLEVAGEIIQAHGARLNTCPRIQPAESTSNP
ncbi:MAG: metalloregulator ArsR/SmtB family transcription factor [Thermaerobacterales bacterium]